MLLRYLLVQKLTAVLTENLLLIACVLADPIRFGFAQSDPLTYAAYFSRAFIVATTFQVFLHLMDVYDFRVKLPRAEFIKRLCQGVLLGATIVSGLNLAIPALTAGFGSIAVILFRFVVMVTVW